jgi:hypothetical protein
MILHSKTRHVFRAATFVALCVFALQGRAQSSTFDFGSLGPIRIGMTRAQLAGAIGPQLPFPLPQARSQGELDSCYYLDFERFVVFFAGGKVSNIVLRDATFKTRRGVGVGSRYDAVLRSFSPAQRVVRHDIYDDRAEVMFMPMPAQQRRFRGLDVSIEFRLDGASFEPSSKVESISIGNHSGEGC